MTDMTTNERMKLTYAHREADRAPIIDLPWESTIARWRNEGLPPGADWGEFFDVDCVRRLLFDVSPRYPVRIVAADDESRTYTTGWGATKKDWLTTGAQGYLNYTITSKDEWLKARQRMSASRDRVPWGLLESNYHRWRERGDWISGCFWFGFEVVYSHMSGEAIFLAMMDDPDWVVDIVNTMLDINIELMEMVWDEGYELDEVMWYNDMGYKHSQFMSVDMYRDLFKEADRRAGAWAHNRDCVVYCHSCGDINPLVPELIEAGVDMLNPLEVKAGMDPLYLKEAYGDKLAFHGGLNAVAYENPEEMWSEMERIIPTMKKDGGYVIGTDHSIPNSVSLQQFGEFVERAKKLARYG